MKGQIGYGGIFLILVAATAIVLYIVKGAEPVNSDIVTVEGRLIAFENYVNMLLNSFDHSADFIFQRAAYDLGRTGGLESQAYWTSTYPKMDVLEQNLVSAMSKKLPSGTMDSVRKVVWGNQLLNVFPCDPPEDSSCFFVKGTKNITVYEKTAEAGTTTSHEFDRKIDSNYFKLLNAGRAVMEDPQLSTHLSDAGALVNALNADPRFNDLDFDVMVSGNVVKVTIEEYCPNKIYCTSPLNIGETEEISGVPYDYNKLIFKYQMTQTGNTPIIPKPTPTPTTATRLLRFGSTRGFSSDRPP